jgi:hypothetical protein
MKNLLTTILLIAAALGVNSAVMPSQAKPTLKDLQGVDELRSLFNHDAGKVRLVMLVSPT